MDDERNFPVASKRSRNGKKSLIAYNYVKKRFICIHFWLIFFSPRYIFDIFFPVRSPVFMQVCVAESEFDNSHNNEKKRSQAAFERNTPKHMLYWKKKKKHRTTIFHVGYARRFLCGKREIYSAQQKRRKKILFKHIAHNLKTVFT